MEAVLDYEWMGGRVGRWDIKSGADDCSRGGCGGGEWEGEILICWSRLGCCIWSSICICIGK